MRPVVAGHFAYLPASSPRSAADDDDENGCHREVVLVDPWRWHHSKKLLSGLDSFNFARPQAHYIARRPGIQHSAGSE